MYEIESARALLPAWVGWSNLLYVPVAALTVALGAVAARTVLPFRNAENDPFQQTSGSALTLACALNAILAYYGSSRLSFVPGLALAALTAAAGYLAGLAVTVTQPAAAGAARAEWWRGLAASWLLRWLWLPLMWGLILVLPPQLDGQALAMLAATAGILLGWACGGGYLLARLCGLARPAPEPIQFAVAEAAERFGVRPPPVDSLDYPYPMAIGVPGLRRLLLTAPLLRNFTEAEIGAVLAFALARMSEPVRYRLARLSWVGVIVAMAAGYPLVMEHGWEILLILLPAALAALWGVRRVVRGAEERVAELGVANAPDPFATLSAIEKLFGGSFVPTVSFFPSGPPYRTPPEQPTTELRYQSVPGPRPARVRSAALLALLPTACWFGAWFFLTYPRPKSSENEYLAMIALRPDAVWIADLAVLKLRAGDDEAAVTLIRASAVMEPQSAVFAAFAAEVLAEVGRLPEATAAANEAERRLRARETASPEEVREVRIARRAIDQAKKNTGAGSGKEGPKP